MSSREGYVEKKVYEFAEKQGFMQRKVKWVGRDGAPDRFFAGRGEMFFVEFKREGGEPEPHQAREIKRLREAGVTVYVIDNVEDGMALFQRRRDLEDLVG